MRSSIGHVLVAALGGGLEPESEDANIPQKPPTVCIVA